MEAAEEEVGETEASTDGIDVDLMALLFRVWAKVLHRVRLTLSPCPLYLGMALILLAPRVMTKALARLRLQTMKSLQGV
jgi:hypothetical protein